MINAIQHPCRHPAGCMYSKIPESCWILQKVQIMPLHDVYETNDIILTLNSQ